MILITLFQYVYDKRFIYQMLVALSTYSSIKLALFIRTRRRRYQIFKYYGIPGPEPSLLDGSLRDFWYAEANFKINERYAKEYGSIYGYYIGDEPIVVITDLDMLSKIFFEQMDKTKERASHMFETWLNNGILFAPHNRWKIMRKLLAPHFSQYKMRGESATQFIEQSVKLMIDHIDKQLDEARAAKQPKTSIRVHNLMKATALHLISATAIKLPDVQVSENEPYVKSLDEFLSQADKGIATWIFIIPVLRGMVGFFATYEKFMALIHGRLNHMIDKGCRSNNNNGGAQMMMIDTLVKLYHEGKLTRNEVIETADSILFAGYDTTSTTLTYVFWALAKFTDIQERLRTELMAHGVESKYLVQIINETMRLYPAVVAFTSRLATQTLEVNGRVIPQGTRIIHNTWLLNRDPKSWPNAERFDPDRFREGANIHPCAFAPFGLGERKCLGYQLAMLEMKMIVCDILLRYRLKLISPTDLELVSCAVWLSKPKEDVIVELERL